MLKGIPNIISAPIMQVLMEMGHGDELVIGDANFPAASHAKRLIFATGNTGPDLLRAILQFFPLEQKLDEHPCTLMAADLTKEPRPAIWDEYEACVREHLPAFTGFHYLERFEFYKQTSNAYAVIASGETALYGNIILKKGLV